jgi:hypothetical protein
MQQLNSSNSILLKLGLSFLSRESIPLPLQLAMLPSYSSDIGLGIPIGAAAHFVPIRIRYFKFHFTFLHLKLYDFVNIIMTFSVNTRPWFGF